MTRYPGRELGTSRIAYGVFKVDVEAIHLVLLDETDEGIRESGTVLGRADALGDVPAPGPPAGGNLGLDVVLLACGNKLGDELRVEAFEAQLAIGRRLSKSPLDVGVLLPGDGRDGGPARGVVAAEVARGHELGGTGRGRRVRHRTAAAEAREDGRGRDEVVNERHDRLTDGIQERVFECTSMR